MEQPGQIEQVKQTNLGAVYRLIDQLGPVSRIELSKYAQLAPASITKIVRELHEAHLVKETKCQEVGSRGRPAVGLLADTEAWHYLSVRIDHGNIMLALRDLSGKIVVEALQVLEAEHPTPLLARIVNEVESFFIRHQNKLERLTAIAITLPGKVNPATGIVRSLPFYHVQEIALGPALEALTGLPVYLQNDICAWTMAEAFYGAARDGLNVIQIVIDHQVGAGVIINGHLLHTDRESLVEIGHMQVDPQGSHCYCGNKGCLETVASTENILALTRQRLKGSVTSILHPGSLTIETLCDAALKGDQLAKEIILEVGYNVGRIVAIMVNIFNPENILIGSPLNRAAEILHPAIMASIQQQSLPAYSVQVQLGSTQLLNSGTMSGNALVKNALYNGSLLARLLQG